MSCMEASTGKADRRWERSHRMQQPAATKAQISLAASTKPVPRTRLRMIQAHPPGPPPAPIIPAAALPVSCGAQRAAAGAAALPGRQLCLLALASIPECRSRVQPGVPIGSVSSPSVPTDQQRSSACGLCSPIPTSLSKVSRPRALDSENWKKEI